jgi:hypothetical protein
MISAVGILSGVMFGIWAIVLYARYANIIQEDFGATECRGRTIRVLHLVLGIFEIVATALTAVGFFYGIGNMILEHNKLGLACLSVLNVVGVTFRACISVATFAVVITLSAFTWGEKCVCRLTISDI